jgi:hypothetical protein
MKRCSPGSERVLARAGWAGENNACAMEDQPGHLLLNRCCEDLIQAFCEVSEGLHLIDC